MMGTLHEHWNRGAQAPYGACDRRAPVTGELAKFGWIRTTVFDLYTIIFLALAVVIFVRLQERARQPHRQRAAAL